MQTTLYAAWEAQSCTMLYMPVGTVIQPEPLYWGPTTILSVEAPIFVCTTVVEPYHVGGCL